MLLVDLASFLRLLLLHTLCVKSLEATIYISLVPRPLPPLPPQGEAWCTLFAHACNIPGILRACADSVYQASPQGYIGGGAGNEATINMQTTYTHYRLTCQFSSTLILTLMMTQPWPRWTPSLSLTRSLSHARETSSTSQSPRDRHDGTLSVIDAKVLFVVNNLLFVCLFVTHLDKE